MNLTTEELETIIDNLKGRIVYIERRINQHERKQLNDPDQRRQEQIEERSAEAEKVLNLIDKLQGGPQ